MIDRLRVALTSCVVVTAIVGSVWDAWMVETPRVGPFTGHVMLACAVFMDSLLLALAWSAWSRANAAIAAIFAGYAGISIWTWSSGASSCGCFGPIHVPPAVTAGLDLLLALLWLAPSRWHIPQMKPCVIMLLGGLLAAACSFGGWLPREHRLPPTLWNLQGSNPTVGHWMVVFYRDSCGHCRETFSNWSMAAMADPQPRGARWCFVSIGAAPPDQRLVNRHPLPEHVTYVEIPDTNFDKLPVAWECVDGRRVALFQDPLFE